MFLPQISNFRFGVRPNTRDNAKYCNNQCSKTFGYTGDSVLFCSGVFLNICLIYVIYSHRYSMEKLCDTPERNFPKRSRYTRIVRICALVRNCTSSLKIYRILYPQSINSPVRPSTCLFFCKQYIQNLKNKINRYNNQYKRLYTYE